MPPSLSVPVPFLVDFSTSTVENITILCVSILVAVTVSAESQGFAATFLGDTRSDSNKRHHFNAFLHLDVFGTICFLLAGFGWAKEVEVDRRRFRHPRLYYLLSRLAGPLGNFIMANIAASLIWILGNFGWEDKVFSGLLVVNMMTAVYGLIIIPPLPGGAILSALLPDSPLWRQFYKYLRLAGPYLLLGVVLLMRFLHWYGADFPLNAIVRKGCYFLQAFRL